MAKYVLGIGLVLLIMAALMILEGDIPAEQVDARYSNAQSRFLNLADGTTVHYRDQGDPDGPSIVLLHGSNSSLHTWEPWVSLLGDTYRIVTLDLPGHGLTGRTPKDDYSSKAFVATVRAVAEHLKLGQFVLGGNSMGGGVTWRYALAYPESVQALILVDASGLSAWWSEQTNADRNEGGADDARQQRANDDAPLAFSLLRQPWFTAIARYIDPYYLVVQGLKASHYDPEFVDDDLIQRYYDLSMRAGTRDATLIRFSTPRGAGDENVSLASLSQPSLIMWGEEDNVIPVSTADRFVQALPNAQRVVYPQVGHIPMEEVPQRSAADVRNFLEQVLLHADN